MKHRLERVRELIKRELGEIIVREVSFGGPLVTIQEADITPDLKNAHIYVSAIGKDVDKNAVIAKLLDHRRELQSALSKRVVLKYTPQLHFHYDETIERGSRVIDILEKIDIPDED
jgi:ribosome-binding factor A